MLNCFTCKLCSTCVFSSVAKIKLLSSLPSQSWLSSLSHHHPLSCLSLHPRRYTYLFLFPLSNIRVAFISKSSHFQLLVRPVSPVVSVSPAILALTIFHLGSCYVLYGCLASVLAFWSTDLIMSVLCSNLQCFPLLLGLKSMWLFGFFMIWLPHVSLASSSDVGRFIATFHFFQLLNEPCVFFPF